MAGYLGFAGTRSVAQAAQSRSSGRRLVGPLLIGDLDIRRPGMIHKEHGVPEHIPGIVVG